MSEWEKFTDERGRPYYYNASLNKTSWTNPDDQYGGWQTYVTEDGRQYYYNEITQVTTWEKPDELNADNSKATDVVTQTADAAASNDAITSVNMNSELEQSLAVEPASGNELLEIGTKVTPAEADQIFTKLLADNKIDSTWSFEDVMKKFITTPEYWAISDSVHRKRVYDEYLVSKVTESALDKQSAIDQFKANFLQVLRNYHNEGILNYSTRWCTVKRTLISRDDPIFKHAVVLDKHVHRILKEYKTELKLEHTSQVDLQREQAMEELSFYLADSKTQQALESTSWPQFYKKLTQNPRFKENKHFESLSRCDILDIYEKQVFPLEIEKLKTTIAQVEKVNNRSDRKAREAFKALILSLEIHPLLSLEPIIAQVENTDEFIDLCGRNGLGPIEIILDTSEQMRNDLIEKANGIWDLLNSSDHPLHQVLESEVSLVNVISKLENPNEPLLDTEISAIYPELTRNLQSQCKQQAQAALNSLQSATNDFSRWLVTSQNDLVHIVQSDQEAKPHCFNFVKRTTNKVFFTATPIPSSQCAAIMQRLGAIAGFEAVLKGVNAVEATSDVATQQLLVLDTINDIGSKAAIALTDLEESTNRKRGAEEQNSDHDMKRYKPQIQPHITSNKPKPVLNY